MRGPALAAGVALGAAAAWRAAGPTSPRARFRRETAIPLEPSARTVTAADLDALPDPVGRWLHGAGVVGRPVPTGLRATFHGRIRSAPDAPWMGVRGRQVNRFGTSPTRWFHLDARMRGLPAEVLHVLEDGHATMRVDAFSVVPVVRAGGAQMDRSEAVTMLNDICLFAPGALVGAPVTWLESDAATARGIYDGTGERVDATLVFDKDGMLVDFVSEDRMIEAGTGRARLLPWSTPILERAEWDGTSVCARGEARWHEPGAAWTYLELTMDSIGYR
ncbi:DUF6544 family protein [Demequina silvatica]|uniref:DUF6544 family protein n=1 Tax=Demequina silvatica TaxID=1638988 RepID=UPI000784AD90|nr:DUF6544 family protein [Demequina silvatica]